jgi:hypothetical protein
VITLKWNHGDADIQRKKEFGETIIPLSKEVCSSDRLRSLLAEEESFSDLLMLWNNRERE